jgi:hypothetical protein
VAVSRHGEQLHSSLTNLRPTRAYGRYSWLAAGALRLHDGRAAQQHANMVSRMAGRIKSNLSVITSSHVVTSSSPLTVLARNRTMPLQDERRLPGTNAIVDIKNRPREGPVFDADSPASPRGHGDLPSRAGAATACVLHQVQCIGL